MIPLLACSLISLALSIERILFWTRLKSRAVINEILALVEKGEYEQALKLGKNSPQPTRPSTGRRHRAPQPRAGQGHGSGSAGGDFGVEEPPRHSRHHRHRRTSARPARHRSRDDRLIRRHGRRRHWPAARRRRRTGRSLFVGVSEPRRRRRAGKERRHVQLTACGRARPRRQLRRA